MRRYISLLLAAIMACSVCACGGAGNTNNDKQQDANEQEAAIRIEDWTDGVIVHLSRKQLKESLTKVTITKENWKEYFADNHYTKHVVNKNAFGDIESEYDTSRKVFGLKKDITFAVFEKVSFKFDGVTFSWGDKYEVIKAGSNKSITYDKDGKIISEVEVPNREYYLCELPFNDHAIYEDHECLDVTGEIILVDFPFEEPYRGQFLIEFTDGGRIDAILSTFDSSTYAILSEFLEE